MWMLHASFITLNNSLQVLCAKHPTPQDLSSLFLSVSGSNALRVKRHGPPKGCWLCFTFAWIEGRGKGLLKCVAFVRSAGDAREPRWRNPTSTPITLRYFLTSWWTRSAWGVMENNWTTITKGFDLLGGQRALTSRLTARPVTKASAEKQNKTSLNGFRVLREAPKFTNTPLFWTKDAVQMIHMPSPALGEKVWDICNISYTVFKYSCI